MVGAADIVADHFRRVAAEEDRAGIADAAPKSASASSMASSTCSAAMRSTSGDGSRRGPSTRMTAPKSRQLCAAISPRGSDFSWRSTAASTAVAEGGVVGDQDRLRGDVVLGLRQQVGGDPVRIVAAVGDHQHLGRAGDHVDADRAEDLALGGRDIGIAGADDLGDRADRLGAIGERGDRLRAADAVDLRRRRQCRRPPAPAG